LATDRKWKKMQQLSLKDKTHRLLFKPKNRVKVLVVAEGPNEEADPDFIPSIANHQPSHSYKPCLEANSNQGRKG